MLSPVAEEPAAPAGPTTRAERALRRVSVAATVATLVLVAVGGLVRATGSGDACPDWPRCHGRLIPALEYHQLIEYSHRLLASVVLVLVAALAALAVGRFRTNKRILWSGVGALAVGLSQAAVGAIVVWTDLEAVNVTGHFVVAMLLVATVVYATVAAHTPHARPVRSDPTARLARLAVASASLLLLVGALVRGERAGLAFTDWPLMNGRVVPSLSGLGPGLAFTHRVLALVVGATVLLMLLRAGREVPRRPVVFVLAGAAAVFYLAQVVVGAANVWTRLATAPVVIHVALSSLVWGALVATAATASALRREGGSS